MKALFGERHKYSASLSRDLFTITDGAMKYYGGSQNLYGSPREKTCGCGISGAADVVMYIEALLTPGKTDNDTKTDPGVIIFDKETFMLKSSELRKKYIPIIPGRGVNSFLLARGMNRYFKKHKMEYRSRWKWTNLRKWQTVERMLKDDIPVILAIGNNFPIPWGKKELNLYVKDEAESTKAEPVYKKQQSVCGHFVVVTAIEENCLTVSSWGRKYYIDIDEYDLYVKKHSINVYSNILEIRRK